MKNTCLDILKKFPKTRKPLPKRQKSVYLKEYKINRGGKAVVEKFSQFVESWMHKVVSKNYQNGKKRKILEIGAGNLNHLEYEKNFYKYDIVEPMVELIDKKKIKKIDNHYIDIKNIPLNKKYDRIISIATFEHILNLPNVILKSINHLRKDGVLSVAIPSEGSMLWGLSWRISTGVSYYLRNKCSYAPVMRYEHVNNAEEIISLLNLFFLNVNQKRFPLPIFNLSVYIYLECKNPNYKILKKINNCI